MQIVGPTAHKIEIAADIYFANRILYGFQLQQYP